MIGFLGFYRLPDEDTILFDCAEEGLILTTWNIIPPKPRFNLVTVPGRSGSIDYTDFYGEAILDRAKITMTLAMKGDADIISVNNSLIKNVHGKSLFFRSSMNQAGRYYKARCYVSTWQRKGGVVTFNISAETEPYMYGARVDGSYTVAQQTSTITPLVIESDGDYVSNCSVSVSANGAMLLCDGNGNLLERLMGGYSREFSLLIAGATNHYNGATAGTVVSYWFYPLYAFECGV